MADRRDYYYRELLTEDELDAGFSGLEDADRAVMADLGLYGVVGELGAVQQHAGTPNLTVDITGPVAIYDKQGARIFIPSAQTQDLSVDDSSVSTAVAGGGNEKWISLFAKFDRDLSDARVDGNSSTVFFVRDESFVLSVVQGAEAAIGAATRPNTLGDGILLADIRLINGQTQILNADISTTRREELIVLSGSPYSVQATSIRGALSDLLEAVNSVAGFGGNLSSQASTSSGARSVGVEALVGTSDTISADNLFGFLGAMKLASHHEYGGGAAWADAITNPATTVEAQLDKIIDDLISTSGSGADKIGCKARTMWLGGRTNVASTLFAAVDKIITDLAATTASDDGAERIGAAASGGFTAGSVRAQLDSIGPTGTPTFFQSRTYSARIIPSGTGAVIGSRYTTIPDSNQSLNMSADEVRCAAPTANRTHTLQSTSNIPSAGDRLTVTRPAAGAFSITIQREDATVVAVLGASAWGSAEFLYTGSVWTLKQLSGTAATAGAGA